MNLNFLITFIVLVSIGLAGCNAPDPSSGDDQNRFPDESTQPQVTVTLNSFDNISGVEGATVASSAAINCEVTNTGDVPKITLHQSLAHLSQCYISESSGEKTVVCPLAFKEGHDNWESDITVFCKADETVAEASFKISVTDTNRPPVLTDLSNLTVYTEEDMTQVNADDTGDDIDIDEDALTYSCTFSGGGQPDDSDCETVLPSDSVSFDTATGILDWKPSSAAAVSEADTVYTITITGSDGQTPALTSAKSFEVTVKTIASPTFSSFDPASPNNSSTSPKVIGTASSDTSTITFYSDSSCLTSLGSGTKADFEGSGVTINVTGNTTTSVYAKAFDSDGHKSTCKSMGDYTHDNTAPTAPVFVSISPTSPSNASNTPLVMGSSSADTDTLNFFSDSSCTTQIGTGNKATFETTGISVTVSSNVTTTIYAQALDTLSNASACTSMTSYTHDTIAPSAPSFTSTNPASPSNASASPYVIGSSSADTYSIALYSDAACTTSLASSTKAAFEGAGIQVSLSSNATTTIYGIASDEAGNTSACTNLTSYVHDDTGPDDPTYSSTNPASPNNSSTTPKIIGSSSADTVTLKIYSDNICSTEIGSGTKADFEGTGIDTTVSANTTTGLYAMAFDSLNNGSNCTTMTNYTHDNTAPADPVYVSATPASPNNSSTTPAIKGTLDADAATVTLYSDAACTTQIGTGSDDDFEGGGISASVTANATTTIYGIATDAVSNASNCTSLTSYTHDNTGPTDPVYSSANPASPTNSTTTPAIIGTSSADTTSLKLFSDASCTTQIGTDTKANFEATGVSATVSSNGTTTIYAIAYDSLDNASNCTSMTSYVHDDTPPTDPSFASTSPVSPNNSSTTPDVIGTSSADTANIYLYSDSLCTTQIGTDTKANFEAGGVAATVSANATTSIYAKAFDSVGNGGNCVSMTSYTHDNTAPADPVFVSTTPASPNNSSTTPTVKGTSDADTATIYLYSDAACTTQIGTDTKANFEDAGVTATVTANATTTIYAKAVDSLSNAGNCVSMTSYVHDNTGPTDPVFASASPASPTNSTTSPDIIGTSSADTSTIKLFSDASCTTQIGTDTKANFEAGGVAATVGSNATTTIYAIAYDSLDNESNCTSMTSYVHDDTGPTDPTFSSTSPATPSNSDTSPEVIGSSSGDTDTVTLYSDNTCSTQIGTGSKADFEAGGITATVTANTTTTVYAKAFDSLSNGSNCTSMTSYVHDSVAPADPAFSSTSPASPSNSSTAPTVIGTSSADTDSITLYSDAACTTSLASGTKAVYEGAGISISVTANTTTSIYAKAFDEAGNGSNCTSLSSYEHDNTGPTDPVFASTDPASPSAASDTPTVIGTSSADTDILNLYSDSGCTTQIGTGTKAVFEAAGISVTATNNGTTTIYAKALDSLSNESSCVSMTSYVHDDTAPTDPGFSSTSPASPNNSSITPAIVGTSDADTATISLYSDAICTAQIGTGTKASFEATGITATVTDNQVTSIYAQASDSLSNAGNCVLLTTYDHDDTGPSDPTFTATSPVSPDNTTTSPAITGGVSGDTDSINFYSDAGCTTSIGSGSSADFTGAGITITAAANDTTAIYGKALDSLNNPSNCVLLTSYVHDNTGPTDPVFSATSPVSPSNSSTTPDITGTASGDTTNVYFYDDAACTNGIGDGTKALFEGAGISLTATSNDTTSIYAKAFDDLNNGGACVSLTSYIHDNVAPGDVGAVTDAVYSTTNSDSSALSWTAATDTTSGISYYEVSIGTSPGDTSAVNWTNVGNTTSTTITSITPNLADGQTYYANVRSVDAAGNTSLVNNSDGWIVDGSAPSTPTVTPEGCTIDTFKAEWSTLTDAHSGLANYEYSLGTSAGDNSLVDWTAAGSTSVYHTGLALSEGSTYYVNVRGVNNAGLTGDYTANSMSCSDINTSLNAFYYLGEGSGTRVDSIGSNDLADYGTSLNSLGGVVGDAAEFNSGGSEYLEVSDDGQLSMNGNFSISVWVYISDKTNTNPIVYKWGGSSDEYSLEYVASTGFRFKVNSGQVVKTITVTNDTWYHIVAYHDDTSDELGISVNAGTPETASYSSGVSSGDSVFKVGADDTGDGYFDGRIDSLGVWEKVLTEHERTRLYDEGNGYEP